MWNDQCWKLLVTLLFLHRNMYNEIVHLNIDMKLNGTRFTNYNLIDVSCKTNRNLILEYYCPKTWGVNFHRVFQHNNGLINNSTIVKCRHWNSLNSCNKCSRNIDRKKFRDYLSQCKIVQLTETVMLLQTLDICFEHNCIQNNVNLEVINLCFYKISISDVFALFI